MPEARALDAEAWQHACPQCGYQNGFHLSLKRLASDRHGNDTAIWLICPSCSSLFDAGLRTRLAQVPIRPAQPSFVNAHS
ncbi:MAG: hypothetical protein FJ291_21265 [Planctomycetes bacterium]|nr:hypothetical protein [Planctomycetota bacterium]